MQSAAINCWNIFVDWTVRLLLMIFFVLVVLPNLVGSLTFVSITVVTFLDPVVNRNMLLYGRRRRTRTVKVRTALSRPCPVGQTDNGQLVSIIRTESGQRTESRQTEYGQTNIDQDFFTKFWTECGHRTENPDTIFRKIWTKTRQGHDTDSAVRRRLLYGFVTWIRHGGSRKIPLFEHPGELFVDFISIWYSEF